MKIIGVIPARYRSSRFPGKPLADICGKPMIWWVYKQAIKVNGFNGEVYVATDDARIEDVCKNYGMNVVMTSENHITSTDRVAEVSNFISSDLYIEIMGDEPLIEAEVIEHIIPPDLPEEYLYVANLTAQIHSPTEVVDFTNLKCVSDINGHAIYISRSPIPYPKGTLNFNYRKLLGISAFNKRALDFYSAAKRGALEEAEDNDFFRFLENGKPVKLIEANCDMLSVDTPKDLDKVREIMNKRLENKN